jgi:stage II sporulation protein D
VNFQSDDRLVLHPGILTGEPERYARGRRRNIFPVPSDNSYVHRRLRLVVLPLITGLAGCLAAPQPDTPRAPVVAAPATIRVGTKAGIVSVPLEDYVLASALSEVSPVGEAPDTIARIFDVQTTIARTYAVRHLGRHRAQGFDLCDTTHCQLYEPARVTTSRFAEAARRAVARTAGVVLTLGGRPIEALYHSDCGGHTSAAEDVWGGGAVPYLVAEPDDVPANTHRHWVFDAPVAKIRAALAADPKSDTGRRLDAITVTARDAGGRAARLEVRGTATRELRGEDLRAVLNRTFGDRAIQSTKFTVRRTGGDFHFDGSGFGHGVGLCQVGAAARARRGDSPAAILQAYFPGVLESSVRGPAAMPGLMEPRATR